MKKVKFAVNYELNDSAKAVKMLDASNLQPNER